MGIQTRLIIKYHIFIATTFLAAGMVRADDSADLADIQARRGQTYSEMFREQVKHPDRPLDESKLRAIDTQYSALQERMTSQWVAAQGDRLFDKHGKPAGKLSDYNKKWKIKDRSPAKTESAPSGPSPTLVDPSYSQKSDVVIDGNQFDRHIEFQGQSKKAKKP